MPKKLLSGVLSLIMSLSVISCGNGLSLISSTIASVDTMLTSVFNQGLRVDLKPINAQAGVTYTVDLYEKGNLRDSTTVSWTQPQINVKSVQSIGFRLTKDEYNTYMQASFQSDNWWKSVFNVKVYDSNTGTAGEVAVNPNTQPTIKLIYPNGGETLRVGQTVNITWKASNLPKDATISLDISNDSIKTVLLPLAGHNGGIPNTGSYKWVVTSSYVSVPDIGVPSNWNTSYIGTHTRIRVAWGSWSNGNLVGHDDSDNDFTISN